MSHSMPPRSKRSSRAPNLPSELSKALAAARKKPDDAAVWDRLDEICRDLDRPEEAAALYSEVMESKAAVDVRVAVGLRAADFCEEWFENTEPVLEMLSRVLSMVPNHKLAFERMTVLLTVAGRWADLLSAYDSALSASQSDAEKAQLLEEAAKVARDFAGDSELGSSYMKALLLLRPSDDQLATVLEKRLDEQGRHQDLIDIWTARLEVIEPASALALRLAIAARLLDRLFKPAEALAAVDAYEAKGGSMMDAIPVLGRVAAPSTTSDDLRREALHKLKRIYDAAGDRESGVRVIEEELRIAPDDEARVLLHRQAAAGLAAIGDKDQALAHSVQVMRLSPLDADARSLAKALAQGIGQPVRYVEALVLAADQALSASEDDRAEPSWVPLLVEAADWSVEVLADPARAIDLYARLADDERTGKAEQLLACQKLSTLLVDPALRPRLLHYLERRAGLEVEPGAIKSVLGAAARLADELGQPEQALELWARRLTHDAEDLEALSARIDLLSRVSAYAGLVEALEARAQASADDAQVRSDLVRAAEVYAEHLTDPESAILRYREVEERFGRTEETVDRLVALELLAGHADRAAATLALSIEELGRAAAGRPGGVTRQVAQLTELGDLQRSHLDAAPKAAGSYAAALELDPAHAGARAGMRALMEVAALAHQASESLAEALVRAGDLRELVGLLEARLAAGPDDAFRAKVLVESARIEEADGRAPEALELVARAFALATDSSTEDHMIRLAHLSRRFDRAAAGYEQAIARSKDSEVLRRLHLAHGRIEEEHTLRLDRATSAYQAALEHAPTDLGLATDVFRVGLKAGLYREAAASFVRAAAARQTVDAELVSAFGSHATGAAWDEVLMGVSDRVAASTDLEPELAHDLKFQLALWYRDAAHDPDSAEMVLRRAVADFPKEASLRVLSDLQRRSPGKPLVDSLLLLSKVCGGDLVSLREAGEVAIGRALEGSVAILEHLLEVAVARLAEADEEGEPSAEASACAAWATDQLVLLAGSAGNTGRAVDLLESAAKLSFPAPEVIQYRFRAAEIAAQGGLSARAVEIGEGLLEDVPDHAPAIALMSQLHEAAGRLEQLLVLRGRELKLGPPLDRRLFLRLDQARVMGILKSPPDERLAVLAQNLVDQPGHESSIEESIGLLLVLERFEEAVHMLEEQASIVVRTDRRRASEMWVRAGLFAEDHLSDTARLEQAFRASVVASPSPAALDRLAQLAHAAGERAQEVSWLEQLLGITPAATDGAEGQLLRRGVVGRLGAALLAADEPTAARELLERELELDPAALEARRLLLDVYTTFEDWKDLAAVLESGVEYAPDDQTRIEYCRRAAFVERRHLQHLDRAVEFLEMALRLAPGERELKVLLADALLEFGGFDRAREILQGLLEEFGRRRTKERASVHKLLARIARADGRVDEALGQAEEAAKIERMDPGILMLLAELARERGELDRAEQAYRTLALVVGRRGATSDGEEPIAESLILFELQRIAEARGNEQQARELLESALEAATRSAEEALRLEECLRSVGKVELLQAAITEQLRSAEGATAAGLLVTRSVIFEKNEELDQALLTRLEALRLQPTNAKLIDATRKLAERLGAASKLWDTLEEIALASADRPEVAGELWYRLGKAAELELDWSRSADFLERSLASGYRSRRSFLALDAVLAQLRNPARTEAALARFVDAPGADESTETLADALYRLAAFEFSAGRADAATHLLRAIRLRADDARTLAVLEPVVTRGFRTSELVHAYLDAARAVGSEQSQLQAHLLAAAEADADAALLMRGLELARALADGPALRTFLSRRIQLAQEALAPAEARAELFERADLAEADRDYDLAASLVERLADLHSGEAELTLRLRLAALLAERLGRDEQAASLYERLLEVAPGQRRVWQPLLLLYRRSGKEAAIEACIAKVEDQVEEREDRELLRMERIRLMIGAGRLDEAEQDLRETLEAEPDFAEAARVLVELLRKAGRMDELRALCTELFDKARERSDSAQVVVYGLELASLYAETPEEASSLLLSGLSVAQTNLDYLRTLHRLLGTTGSPSDRSDVLEYLARAESGPRAAEVALELVLLKQAEGDQRGLGLALELGYEVAPGDGRIGENYVAYLRESEDFGRLADVLLERAKRATDVGAAVLGLSEAAGIYDQRLGDPAQAAAAMLEAFSRQQEDAGLLRSAVDYMVMSGQVDAALEQLGAAIAREDEMTLGDLLDLRARVLERERASQPPAMEQAAADLARALDQLLPEDQEAEIQARRREILERLEASYADSGQFDRMRKVALSLAAQCEESGQVDGAVQGLLSYLERQPGDAQVALRLGALAQGAGDFEAAISAYQALFDASSGADRRQAALSLAAAATELGDPMRAKDQLTATLRDYPRDAQVLSTLRDAYAKGGAHRELADLLLAEAAVAEEPAGRFALLVEAGDLMLLAGDAPTACELFEQARPLTREPYLIVTKLARAYLYQGEVERAQSALDEALEVHGKRRTPELALLQHGLASVADARGDVDGMFTWLETALMTDRSNGEVASELAIRAQDSGRYDMAVRALQVIALGKGDIGMGKAEAYYRQAQIAADQGDAKKALMLARRALTTDGAFSPAQQLVAQLS